MPGSFAFVGRPACLQGMITATSTCDSATNHASRITPHALRITHYACTRLDF